MFNLQRTEKCFPNLLLEIEGLFLEDPVWGNPVWLTGSLVMPHAIHFHSVQINYN